MAIQMRALDRVLVGSHVHFREEVLGSIPSTPKNFANPFRRTLATFEECPFVGTSFTVDYTVFQGYLQCGNLL